VQRQIRSIPKNVESNVVLKAKNYNAKFWGYTWQI
jgi:hypothetical protein